MPLQKDFFTALILLFVSAVAFWASFLSYPSEIFQARNSSDQSFLAGTGKEDDFARWKNAREKLSAAQEEVSLIAVGDIMLSRNVARKIHEYGDPDYPFLKVSDYLRGADMVFGNLEAPIIAGTAVQTNQMMFRADPGEERALKNAGFSVLSLANNHIPNFGAQGLKKTFELLSKEDIAFGGAGNDDIEANRPAYQKVKGFTFALLAYNDPDVVPPDYQASKNHPGTAFMNIQRMSEAVKNAREKADFVIVSMHSGAEYTESPNVSQMTFARAAISAGAELVIGHHPHVAQSIEVYHGKYIFYSLGNFVFDQMWSRETREGLTLKIFFNRSGVDRVLLMPVLIENFSQPRLLDGQAAERVFERLRWPLALASVVSWNSETRTFEEHSWKMILPKHSSSFPQNVKQQRVDLNRDGAEEWLELKDGIVNIRDQTKLAWTSSERWWIDDFAIADANGDGRQDLNLSLWKAGNYGSSRPFWAHENDPSIKNHFFIFDFQGNTPRPLWQSSNLEAPNCQFLLEDMDGDNKAELLVLEGEYTEKLECRGKYFAIWKWNGWGFSNEWRGALGNFSRFWVEKIDGKKYIVVE